MEREWLITLLYYRSLGTTKNELQFYKVGDHYEMAHVTKTLSASIDENKQNNELDLKANEKYETNTAINKLNRNIKKLKLELEKELNLYPPLESQEQPAAFCQRIGIK